MKLTLKEYRAHIMKTEFGGFRNFLFTIGIFKLRIKDSGRYKNNNDYSYELLINIHNPLSYVFLLIWAPLYFIVNGCNKDSYMDVKKEIKTRLKK
jgi:hypothetical protein